MRIKMLLGLAVLAASVMGASQSAHADRNWSMLFSAVESGDLRAVRQVLDGGADVEGRNADGLTPLMAAVQTGRADIVRELLARGAEVNASVGFYGITALTLAGLHGRDSEIAALLVQAGAIVDVPDERDRIPVIVSELE